MLSKRKEEKKIHLCTHGQWYMYNCTHTTWNIHFINENHKRQITVEIVTTLFFMTLVWHC